MREPNPTSHGGAIPTWTLGDRLAKSLRQAKLLGIEMANYLDVSPGTISSYINDRREPDRRTLLLWAERTGVDLHWLETGEAPTPPPRTM